MSGCEKECVTSSLAKVISIEAWLAIDVKGLTRQRQGHRFHSNVIRVCRGSRKREGIYIGDDGSIVVCCAKKKVYAEQILRRAGLGESRFIIRNYIEPGGIVIASETDRCIANIGALGDTHHGIKALEECYKMARSAGCGYIYSYANPRHCALFHGEVMVIHAIELLEQLAIGFGDNRKCWEERQGTYYCATVNNTQTGRKRLVNEVGRKKSWMRLEYRDSEELRAFTRLPLEMYEEMLESAKSCLIPTINGQLTPQIIHCVLKGCVPITDCKLGLMVDGPLQRLKEFYTSIRDSNKDSRIRASRYLNSEALARDCKSMLDDLKVDLSDITTENVKEILQDLEVRPLCGFSNLKPEERITLARITSEIYGWARVARKLDIDMDRLSKENRELIGYLCRQLPNYERNSEFSLVLEEDRGGDLKILGLVVCGIRVDIGKQFLYLVLKALSSLYGYSKV